jgi:hypothetical protein
VYNSAAFGDRKELYPGDRSEPSTSRPSHVTAPARRLASLEGEYGGKFRWIGERATLWLQSLRGRPAQRLRIRGYAPEQLCCEGKVLTVKRRRSMETRYRPLHSGQARTVRNRAATFPGVRRSMVVELRGRRRRFVSPPPDGRVAGVECRNGAAGPAGVRRNATKRCPCCWSFAFLSTCSAKIIIGATRWTALWTRPGG